MICCKENKYMSDYRYMRVIRCKVDMNKIGVSSIWDLEDKFSDLFDMNFSRYFTKAPVEEENYLDYVLESKGSYNGGAWGKSRYLTDNEAVKYLALFSQIYPDVRKEDLRAVEFCWYDCSEAPLYFNVVEEEWL
jgi:hypothetical protein